MQHIQVKLKKKDIWEVHLIRHYIKIRNKRYWKVHTKKYGN